MSVWFTSDLHIGHKKVARFRAEESGITNLDDIEDFIEDHDDILAERWDQVVGKDDQVWVLGDISSGTKQGQLDALLWLMKRPGEKNLIAGNHDSIHPLHRDSHKWFPAYMQPFKSVQMAAKRRIPLTQGHVTLLLSHFPYTGDRGEDRYPEWRLKDAGHYLAHGHTHSQGLGSAHPKQIHIGVDAWDFKPVHLDLIIELIRCAEEAPPKKDWSDVPLFEVDLPGIHFKYPEGK